MTRHVRIDPQCPSASVLDAAAAVLQCGGGVAYLTDTVYGLAVDARMPHAIAGLFALKGRSSDKAIPLIIGAPEQLWDVAAALPRHAGPLMAAFWPGPLTLLLRPHPNLPAPLLGNTERIGVRWPASPLSQGLALRIGGAITASSANRSGAAAAQSAAEVQAQLAPDVQLILDSGTARNSQVSTVLDITAEPPRMVRAGRISQQAIESVLGCKIAASHTEKGRKS
jgi:L-threonylcarbamoyladenylate synthase